MPVFRCNPVWLLFAACLGGALGSERAASGQGGAAKLPPGPARFDTTANMYTNRYTNDKHDFKDLLKWRRERKGDPPLLSFPLDKPPVDSLRANRSRASLTWVGHSTFLIQAGGANILTDPHFGERASPVGFAGPKRGTAPGIALSDLPPIDMVVISHNHYDHLDAATVKALVSRPGGDKTQFYAPLGLQKWLESRGARAVEMNWFESGPGEAAQVRVHAVPVRHWSKRGFFDTNRTLWAGFVIEAGGLRFYFAGDTGYGPDFRDAADRYGSPDIALLPIGAYEPRWFMGAMHMNPEEAVQAHLDLGSKLSVGMHWGTFSLTDEPMDEPPRRLKAAMETQPPGTHPFIVMRHGETRWLPAP
jgi:N-acyl-phosphatidylethanolamine-hydrolysing phospholipase D